MYHVDVYAKVRRFCFVEGHSSRHASRVFGLSRATIRKMLTYSEPPGYRRNQPVQRPVPLCVNISETLTPCSIRVEGNEDRVMMEGEIIKKDAREGARRASGVASFFPAKQEGKSFPVETRDPEVSEKPVRRKFSAREKLRILKMADACTESGSLGALLRREGLYSSNLKTWRRQREAGTLSALRPKKRGRKKSDQNPLGLKVGQLEKENDQLRSRLKQAELIIEVQKKVSQILRTPLEGQKSGENN